MQLPAIHCSYTELEHYIYLKFDYFSFSILQQKQREWPHKDLHYIWCHQRRLFGRPQKNTWVQCDLESIRWPFNISQLHFIFVDVAQPKGDWKPEDIATVGEVLLDVSIQLARTWVNSIFLDGSCFHNIHEHIQHPLLTFIGITIWYEGWHGVGKGLDEKHKWTSHYWFDVIMMIYDDSWTQKRASSQNSSFLFSNANIASIQSSLIVKRQRVSNPNRRTQRKFLRLFQNDA